MNTAQPSRRDRLRPVELLVLAGAVALFTGLVVLLTTREPILGVIFLGVAFIVTLVVLAMLAMYVDPDDDQDDRPVLMRDPKAPKGAKKGSRKGSEKPE